MLDIRVTLALQIVSLQESIAFENKNKFHFQVVSKFFFVSTKMTLVLNCSTLALFVTRIWFGSQRPTAMCAGGPVSGFEAGNRGGALLIFAALLLCQAGDGAALPPVAAATGAMLAPELGGHRDSVRIWSK